MTKGELEAFVGKDVILERTNGEIVRGLARECGLGLAYCLALGDVHTYGSNIKSIKLLNKTMKNLETGDLLVNGKYYRKVLGVCGEVIFISDGDTNKNSYALKRFGSSTTLFNLEESGWKLAEEEPELIEIEGKKYKKQAVRERLKELKEEE